MFFEEISVGLSVEFVDMKFCSGGPIIDGLFYLLSAIRSFLNNRFFVLPFYLKKEIPRNI